MNWSVSASPLLHFLYFNCKADIPIKNHSISYFYHSALLKTSTMPHPMATVTSSPFLPSSPIERKKQGFVRSDAPSPASSFDGPRYVKELFEVIAPEISFLASGSPNFSDRGSPTKKHSYPQLGLDFDLDSTSIFPRSKSYSKKHSNNLSSKSSTHKTTDISPARVARATRALSSSLQDTQQHLAAVIALREHQRAHAELQTSILHGLESDKLSAEMEVEGKRNELEAVEAEIKVLKSAKGGLKGRLEKRRTRLPLKRACFRCPRKILRRASADAMNSAQSHGGH